MKCRNMKGLKAAMEAAMPLLEKQPDELDSNPFLLNTPSCTLNLTEGLSGMQEHNPEDYITKVTAVSPDDIGADIWNDTLNLIFCDDRELIKYVQRIVGMAVIGKVYIEALLHMEKGEMVSLHSGMQLHGCLEVMQVICLRIP